MATPSGSSIAPATAVHGLGERVQRLGRPGQVAGAARRRSSRGRRTRRSAQRFWLPSRQRSQWPQCSAGSTATRRPSSGPPSTTPANSWPTTSGLAELRVADPALLVPVQVRPADPHRLDAHEALPRARAPATASSATRMSPAPYRRATAPRSCSAMRAVCQPGQDTRRARVTAAARWGLGQCARTRTAAREPPRRGEGRPRGVRPGLRLDSRSPRGSSAGCSAATAATTRCERERPGGTAPVPRNGRRSASWGRRSCSSPGSRWS